MKALVIDNLEFYELVFGSAILFASMTGFIIYFLMFHRKKQVLHILQQEKSEARFQQEITKTQLEVQEQTMQTIGADLHDNIGQLLSLTSLTLNSIELKNAPKARQKIDAAIDLTVRSIKEMRLLGKLLQGDQLIVMGLSEAIQYEITWIEKSGHYKVTYTNDGEMPAANSPDKDLILFRILQEILNNIIKHAKATEINIKLDYQEAVLQLQVSDNGIGFNSSHFPSEPSGMGLQNIQKRAGIIGGEVTIISNPDEGATITVFIPYP
jgi:two-component system NarL family sensor kinase